MSIPCRRPSREALLTTLESLVSQAALRDGQHELQIVLVHSETPASLIAEASAMSGSISVMGDSGMGLYAALAESFPLHVGDLNGYLGVGDSLEPQAFSVLAELANLEWIPRPHWFTGIILGRRNDGTIVRSTQPPAIRRAALRNGRAGRLTPGLQQESTFWGVNLHRRIDLDGLRYYRLAGDLFLWKQFSKWAAPVTVEAALGSFRWHGDNMSADWESYQAECDAIFGHAGGYDRVRATAEMMTWALPTRLKRRLGGRYFASYTWPDGPWVGRTR